MENKFCYFSVCDNEYIPHFLAMLTSLSEVEKDIQFFLVQTELTQDNISIINDHARVIDIDLTVLGNPGIDLSIFAPCGNYPEAVWLKFYIDQLFPKHFERILYIDPDIIILNKIKGIFEIDMNTKPLASVIDMKDADIEFKQNLGIPATGKYFNFGLVLFDRKKYVELDIGDKAAEFARSNPQKISFIDQCAYNAVAWQDILELDNKWNLMAGCQQGQPENANILHFCAVKPWEKSKTPGRELYIHFRNRTPFPFKVKTNKLLEEIYFLLDCIKFYKNIILKKNIRSRIFIKTTNRIKFRRYWKKNYKYR